jgi:hypothetical protein
MGTINKKAYCDLIEQDLAALKKYMPECSLERQHISNILEWSIKQLFPESEKPIVGIFLLGEKYSLDLGSSAPVEVKPLRYTEKGVVCRYLCSSAGRVETISYGLLKSNGFGKTKVRVEWFTGDVTIEHLFGEFGDNYYFNPSENQSFIAPKEWCEIIDGE